MTRYDDLCDTITAKIVAAIETIDTTKAMELPWHQMGFTWAPCNAKTGAYYGGSNIVVLATEAMETDDHPEWTSPLWATYKQWTEIGGQVRKGETSTQIVKWVPKRRKDNDEDRPTTPDGKPMMSLNDLKPPMVPKVYNVFNVAQVDDWESPPPAELIDHTPINAAETWIASSGASITYGHDHALYNRRSDRIEVPAIGQYREPVDHYAIVCHELVHWTGHKTRLNRTFGERFGDDAYAAEELVAELGSAFTCARLGLTNAPRQDHAAYLGHWLRILKADPKALFATAAAAQKAVAFIADLADPAENSLVAGRAA